MKVVEVDRWSWKKAVEMLAEETEAAVMQLVDMDSHTNYTLCIRSGTWMSQLSSVLLFSL